MEKIIGEVRQVVQGTPESSVSPIEILGLTSKPVVWLLEFDYQLLTGEVERLEQDAPDEKIVKIRE